MAGVYRVAHGIFGLAPAYGGVVRAAVDQASLLARAGHEVSVVAGGEAHEVEGLDDRVRLEWAGGGMRWASGGLWAGRWGSLDLLHLHEPWRAGNLLLARAARRAGVPYVVNVHGMLDRWSLAQGRWKKRIFLALAGRRFLEGAAAVLATAEGEREQGQEVVPGARWRVLGLPVDLAGFEGLPGRDEAREAWGLEGAVRRLLFLGRIHPKKGLHHLVGALGRLGGEIELLVAGPGGDGGYGGEVRRRAEALGVAGRMRWLGAVYGDEKRALLRAADLLVVPTSQENFGLVFPEAMACGLPVLTTRGVDIWRELEGAGALVVEDGGDEKSLAAAIAALLGDGAGLAERGERGRAWVRSTFAEPLMAAAYEAMVNDVAGGRR